MKKLALLLAFMFIVFSSFSQNQDKQENIKEDKKEGHLQITFAYPVGIHGINSMNYRNKVSVNILFGINGGFDGIEFGSIGNYNTGDVKGMQFAGVLNVNQKKAEGFIIGGTGNIILGKAKGFVLSSSVNFTKDTLDGFQLSTVNIGNYVKGMQLGTVNMVKEVDGFQLGVVNLAQKVKGVQMGVVNFGNKTKGAQIGIVNIAPKGEGVTPVGLINVVKGGLYELEVSGSEALYSNISFKMGVERFYSVFTASFGAYNGKFVHSTGFGFGGNIKLAEKHSLDIFGTANQIIYDGNFEGELNLLNKFNINYKYRLNKGFSLFAGPTLNVYVSKEKVDGRLGTINIPYSIYKHESKNTLVSIWSGLNLGVSYRF
ncbi:MAG: LA_2272 family surface repeat-containing protein [Bacteroidales bacterium]